MLKQPFCNFVLAGVSLTDFGLKIPSPFASLELTNSEITSATSWTLKVIVGGDDKKRVNVAAFEALLYSAAQSSYGYDNASGIPVSFMFGWLDNHGNIAENISYQGFTLQFDVSTSGIYLIYNVKGYATLAVRNQLPLIPIPELVGIVQPSAVAEAFALAIKADTYYDLDIDHDDEPTFVSHGAMTTSFINYVRGSYTGKDDYNNFPGLLKLSKSYSGSKSTSALKRGIKSVSQVLDSINFGEVSDYFKPSIVDEAPISSGYSFWIDEPTMTKRGTIHYKSDAGLLGLHLSDTLQFGTTDSNVLSLSGSYNGVAYNLSDMNFSQIGFDVDGSGNTIVTDARIVNSWSSSLASAYQTVNIVNDLNAIATQFSGEFTVTIPGSTREYMLAQPISLLVMSGNTISPITGIYNIMSVSHSISNTFTTTLKLQRLTMSTANQTAAGQNIFIRGSSSYPSNSYTQTPNIISTSKVDFGTIYPDYTYMWHL